MTISASPRVATAGEPLTYTVRVTNLGRSPAPDGLISITLKGPQNLVSATIATGPIAVQDSKLTLATGTIAARRSVTLTVLTTPNKSGSVVGLSIEVASAARERRRDNNETVKWVGVSRAPGAEDGIHALEFAASDMAWDSIRGRIYASVPEPDPDRFQSQVLALNPESLEVSRTIDLPGKPGRLALTQRSKALYVAINGGNAAISRLTPSTMSLHSRFPLAARGRDNSTVILDLCPVPGAPELLFVIRGSDSNAPPRDGAIDLYRRGRSIRSLNPEGSFFSSIDATDAPDVFVAADTSPKRWSGSDCDAAFSRLRVRRP